MICRLAVACAIALGAAGAAGPAAQAAPSCPPPHAGTAYWQRVDAALRSRRDLWGDELLASRAGPTYEGARRYLRPLLLARAPGKRPLTASGVHYVAFGQPLGPQGAGTVALHVADGSQIVSDHVGEPSVMISVGGERYGACLARLATPLLADGWLPILETRYRGRFEQESFAARSGDGLASYVALRVQRGTATAVRLGTTTTRVPANTDTVVYGAWMHDRRGLRPLAIDAEGYAAARASVASFWRQRLDRGARFDVPEPHVMDAERNLLVQNLVHTWRYSLGNPYEEFSFPESVDLAQVTAEYGFTDVAAAILRTSLTRRPVPYPNWKMGERLLATALYFRLSGDRAHVERTTPVLAGYVRRLGSQLGTNRRGLLRAERYSSDIPDTVLGLHSQAVAWQGLREMGATWDHLGRHTLAATCRTLARRLERGLRAAVAASQRRLADGSLFLPARLLDDERPYGSLTEARLGSYWNLVVPYALASGLFPPHGAQARGALRYLLGHGSRLLGLVRAGAYALYREPRFPVGGTDNVYGINVARFLADNDESDQLVLSLYGALAAGMTPGTFVSGEAASVAPLNGGAFRSMYLPPNAASNAAFLTVLRLTLLHETRTAAGTPRGLELAYATPRAWLAAGKRVAVHDAPTSFGRVSYSIDAGDEGVRAALELPAVPDVSLRVRLPRGVRLGAVRVDGVSYARVDRATQTIRLGARRGSVKVEADYA